MSKQESNAGGRAGGVRVSGRGGSAVAIKMADLPVAVSEVVGKSDNGFKFTGTDTLDKKIESFIVVPTSEQAVFELEKAGITIDSISPRKAGGRRRNRRPSRLDYATFAETFGEQMEIGGSAAEICEQIAVDLTNTTLMTALRGSADMIRNGSPVYLAFAAQVDEGGAPVFPVNLIYSAKIAEETGAAVNPETGESEGAWQALMRRFAEGMKEADAIAGQVKSAAYYPVGVFGFCIVAVLFVLYAVMPKFKEMYEALLTGKDDKLPFLTQGLIDLSDFLLSWPGLFTMIGVAIGCVMLFRWFRSPSGQLWWQVQSLKLPVFGDFYKDMHAASALRTISMLASGEPDIKKRFSVAADTCPNIVYRNIFQHISHRLSAGLTVTEVSTPYSGYFGSDFRQVTRAVDGAGDMQGQFYRYAKILETRAKRKLERVLALFSTFAILPVGILIGMVVLALYLPLFQLVGRMAK